MLTTLAVGQNYFPDVPENHAFYRLARDLDAFGLLRPARKDWFLHRNHPDTRDLFAEEAIQTIAYLVEATKSNTSSKLQVDLRDLRFELLPGLRRWVAEFHSEIVGKGVRTETLLAQLDTCDSALAIRMGVPRFSDIPGGHWASRDVQELKYLGILVGYPGGKFHGDK